MKNTSIINVHTHEHTHEHNHEHTHEHTHEHDHEHTHSYDSRGHAHSHAGMHDIIQIVNGMTLPEKVKNDIIEVYTLIAKAERTAHGVPGNRNTFSRGRYNGCDC